MIQQTMHEHLIGLSFERTVAEVQQVLTTYKESVDAAVAKRVEKITKLIEETKSEGSDADVVIAWAQRNTQWSQAPLRPAMLAMLTEATLASMERGLSKQLAALVGWLDVDVKRDPTRILELRQSDMTIFMPYDADSLRHHVPYYGGGPALGAVGISRFGGTGVGNFRELAASVAVDGGGDLGIGA